jgi:hypothetical protein
MCTQSAVNDAWVELLPAASQHFSSPWILPTSNEQKRWDIFQEIKQKTKANETTLEIDPTELARW